MARLISFSSSRISGLGVVLAAAGLIQVSYWIAHTERAALPPGVCIAWDEAAKHALAPLVHQHTLSGTDRELLDALATLRRARHNCAAGRLQLARRDYEVLRGAAPPATSTLAQE